MLVFICYFVIFGHQIEPNKKECSLKIEVKLCFYSLDQAILSERFINYVYSKT